MIQNNILRLLQRADNDNAIYTAEITDFDKFVIAMMYSLPPVPSKELKKILSYIAHTVTITASIKRLENFSYIYHDDTQKEDTYYTFSHATTRVLSSK